MINTGEQKSPSKEVQMKPSILKTTQRLLGQPVKKNRKI